MMLIGTVAACIDALLVKHRPSAMADSRIGVASASGSISWAQSLQDSTCLSLQMVRREGEGHFGTVARPIEEKNQLMPPLRIAVFCRTSLALKYQSLKDDRQQDRSQAADAVRWLTSASGDAHAKGRTALPDGQSNGKSKHVEYVFAHRSTL